MLEILFLTYKKSCNDSQSRAIKIFFYLVIFSIFIFNFLSSFLSFFEEPKYRRIRFYLAILVNRLASHEFQKYVMVSISKNPETQFRFERQSRALSKMHRKSECGNLLNHPAIFHCPAGRSMVQKYLTVLNYA